MNPPPLYLGQQSYAVNLIDRAHSRVERNPSRRAARRFAKDVAVWHIVEATAVFNLDNHLVWHERVVGHYHYGSISRRRMNKLILCLNINPLHQFFYKYTTINGTVVGQHKERRLVPSPMSVKRLRPILEERVIDYFTMPAPIDHNQLIHRERLLEDEIANYHLMRKETAQQSYYRSLLSQSINQDEITKLNQLLGEEVEEEVYSRLVITNKSERASRAINSIGKLR